MEPLLYLVHRIPYPPNKGDKLRSYHVLRHLAARYRILLGTFVDDAEDWRHVEAVRALCADTYVARLRPHLARLRGLAGLLAGEPLTVAHYRDAGLQAWVDATIARQGVKRVVVFSSAMAQYVAGRQGLRRVVDFVDVDSDKWRQYALKRPWPLSWVFRREARTLLGFERRIAVEADASFFVTAQEAALFTRLAPECAQRVHACANGVDAERFSPAAVLASPYPVGERPLVFTGAMDYWPNIDAVCWFAREALPLVRAQEPAARFYVVGMNPPPAVRALARDPAVVVTGRVDDVRPYVRHAAVAVAPLRVARGVQNKVLEAMAMAKPVVTSSASAAALSARAGVELEVADTAQDFAARTLAALDPARAEAMGRAARRRVLADYDWRINLRRFDEALGADGPGGGEPGAGVAPSGPALRPAVTLG